MDLNDIWGVSDLKWNYRDDMYRQALGSAEYFEQTADGGLKIHLKKEENMNKNKLLKDVDRIIIDKSYDGKTVTAVAQKRTTEKGSPFFPCMIDVAKASATCGPNDIFDFNIGAKLALDRLYEGYDMTPKPKRKPYNGKIFIECYPGSCLENHRVYQVYNGLLPVITTNTNPYIFCDMDDCDLSFAIHNACWDHNAIKGSLLTMRTRAYFVKE